LDSRDSARNFVEIKRAASACDLRSRHCKIMRSPQEGSIKNPLARTSGFPTQHSRDLRGSRLTKPRPGRLRFRDKLSAPTALPSRYHGYPQAQNEKGPRELGRSPPRIGNEIAITKDRLRAVFCLCLGRSPSRRHRTMPRLLRTVVDEISPVLLEGLAWNRMCQLAPSVRLAYRKLLLS